jgi:hypothetical protein
VLTSELDSDYECVELPVPSLSVELRGSHRSMVLSALADSGASSSFLTGRVVDKLGLVRRKLKVPRRVKLAIQGKGENKLVILHFVRVPLFLANRTWGAGYTLFKVAELEPPFNVILATPFLT